MKSEQIIQQTIKGVTNESNSILLCVGISLVSLVAGLIIGKTIFSKRSNSFCKKKQKQTKKCCQKKEKSKEEKPVVDEKKSSNNGSSDTSVTPASSNNDEYTTEEEEEEDDEEELLVNSTSLNDIPGEVRMVFAIRTDLGMTKGKIAAQCCHAAVNLYKNISDPQYESYNVEMLRRWERRGQAKITLKIPGKDEMDLLYAQAISLNVNCTVIHDAGRTQIPSGSATVLGIGPAPKMVIDQITGNLKLY